MPRTPDEMRYDYRASALKGQHGRFVVLAAAFRLKAGHDPAAINARMSELVAHRKQTQPPGASLTGVTMVTPLAARSARGG